MAKTTVKKSIKVEDILHSLNWQLANQHEPHNGRFLNTDPTRVRYS